MAIPLRIEVSPESLGALAGFADVVHSRVLDLKAVRPMLGSLRNARNEGIRMAIRTRKKPANSLGFPSHPGIVPRLSLLFAGAFSIALASPLRVAAIYDPFEIENARAAGMGRVTAVAGDGTIATWWNPASLAFVKSASLAASDADFSLFFPDGFIRSATWSAPLPWGARRFGAGLGVKRADYDDVLLATSGGLDDEVRWWDQAYVGSVGFRASEPMSLGLALEYLWTHMDVPRSGIGGGSDGAFSVSIGAAYRNPISFGAAGTEATGGSSVVITPLAAATLLHLGQKRELGEGYDLPRQLRGAAGIQVERAPPEGTPAWDLDRAAQFALVMAIEAYVPATEWEYISTRNMIVHFGTELMLFGILSGRLGFIDNNEFFGESNHVDWDNTYGFGVGLPEALPVTLRFDWAAAPWGQSDRVYRRTFSVALRP